MKIGPLENFSLYGMARAFPMFTNANEHILLALGSKGRDDVEISRGRGQSACSRMFICVKSHETNIQKML